MSSETLEPISNIDKIYTDKNTETTQLKLQVGQQERQWIPYIIQNGNILKLHITHLHEIPPQVFMNLLKHLRFSAVCMRLGR